ncbi:MAG TPA: hypothetical protein VNA10_05745, partial [Thermoplasmata archaeon]|nr:hypothetical protein [Thermoplasmata archaeon]
WVLSRREARVRLSPWKRSRRTISMRYWSVTSGRKPEFLSKGFKGRRVFPHTLHYLPKAGPGALRFSGPMCGITLTNGKPPHAWSVVSLIRCRELRG